MGLFTDLGQKYSNTMKPMVERAPGLKWVGQSPTNFWTGFRVTKGAAALGVSALALYSVGAGAKAAYDYKHMERRAGAVNVGTMAATQIIDPNLNTSARGNLGATGDLVFGLNNMRRGG